MEKEYIVTLRNRGDLEKFYDDMENSGGPEFVPDREVEVAHKRPISRNTHYLLTKEEAETLKNDERVWGVAEPLEGECSSLGSRSYTSKFSKEDKGITDLPSWPISSTDAINWGILHCTGDSTQRRKDAWGPGDLTLTLDMSTFLASQGNNFNVGDEVVCLEHNGTGYSSTSGEGIIKSYNQSTGIMVITKAVGHYYKFWTVTSTGPSLLLKKTNPLSTDPQILFTSISTPPLEVTDSVTIFNNGENVDVVIVDTPVAKDHDEYLDPDTGLSRFVEYQWNLEHGDEIYGNDFMWSLYSTATKTITYPSDDTLASASDKHGTHVAGIATGRAHGWANKSNVYGMCVMPVSSLSYTQGPIRSTTISEFDFLRVFHKRKPINPSTGKRNPTISNHSYGRMTEIWMATSVNALTSSQLPKIRFRGSTYNNPDDGTWTQSFLLENFGLTIFKYATQWGNANGFQFNQLSLNYSDQNKWPDSVGTHGTAYKDEGRVDQYADIDDAIAEGVVVVTAAGNSSEIHVPYGHEDYDNAAFIIGTNSDGSAFQSWCLYNRASFPQHYPNIIVTGNMSTSANNEMNTSSSLGSNLYVMAPGTDIEASGPSSSSTDKDLTLTGTSMAGPQTCGVLACLFTNMDAGDVNQARAMQYLEEFSLYDDVPNVHSDGNTHSLNFDCMGSLNGAPNRTLRAVDRRIVYKESNYGYILFNETPRNKPTTHTPKSGMIYPRKKVGRIRF